MVTNKKRLRQVIQFLLMTVAAGWLGGCMPSGPGALLEGKRLLEQGKNTEAIDELKLATSLLATNAQAWNYLGLAYHHAGQAANALDAYQRALSLNHDLVAVHYNLGCLWLEQNRPDTLDGARNELTAFTVRKGTVVDGWLKLGTAELRLGQLTPAEASFKEALQLSPQNPEALNDLGMAQLQRRRLRDAVTYFNNALKQQPNYGPALLNLAVTEIYLNNRAFALQKYQEYLALNPRPANWETVSAAAEQLDQELNPPPRPATNIVLAAVNPPTNNLLHAVATNTNATHVENVVVTPKPTNAAPWRPPSPADSGTKPEVVKLPDGSRHQSGRKRSDDSAVARRPSPATPGWQSAD